MTKQVAPGSTAALEDTEHALRALLLDPSAPLLPDVPEARQRVLRRLVQNNLRRTITRAAPHAHRLAGEQAFDALVTRFLAEAPPTTRLVREIPSAFARFVGALAPDAWPDASFAELVHWETLELEVLFAPDADRNDSARADTIEAHPSARLCAYRHDVLAVDDDTRAWPSLRAEPALVLCFRVDERVRWRRLSGACARVLAAVAGGAALSTARSSLPDSLHSPLDAELRALEAEGALLFAH